MKIEDERKLGLKWLAAMCVLAMAASYVMESKAQSIRTWAVDPSVKYNPDLSPYTLAESERAIREAVWAWSSRIPALDIQYVGTTSAPVERAIITYRWESLVDYLKIVDNIFSMGAEQSWVYLDTGYVSRSVIHLNAVYFSGQAESCETMVFSHELGHALGINGHSPNPDDLMYYAPAHCRYMPSDNDIKLLGHTPTTCHAVLAHDYGIYIPDVMGKAAMLEYQGGQVWKLEYMKDNPRSHGCKTVSVDDGGLITITDLQGYTGKYSRVELSPIADNTWKLQWAE